MSGRGAMQMTGEVATRIFAGAGLGMSALLLWEYEHPGAALCGPGGGCDVVKHSRYAHILGVPTPAFGIAFFAALLVISTLSTPWSRRALLALAGVGAAVAAGLLALQAVVIGAFCKYCVITDVSSLGLLASVLLVRGAPAVRARLPRVGYLGVSLVFAAIPLSLIHSAPQPPPDFQTVKKLPAPVARVQVPGKVTIVEFVDYQCPFCRAFHAELARILPRYGARVRVVRFNVPLPMHKFASYAARVEICAAQRGHGPEMANALFESKSLARTSVEAIANRMGIPTDALRKCVLSDATTDALLSDLQAAKAAGVVALPTYYIGHERFEGVRPPAELRRAIDRALAALPAHPPAAAAPATQQPAHAAAAPATHPPARHAHAAAARRPDSRPAAMAGSRR